MKGYFMFIKGIELVGLMGVFTFCLSVNLHAMEQKQEIQEITLQAGEGGLEVKIPKEVAELSKTLKDMMEDIDVYSTPIPLPNLDSPLLESIVMLMQFVYNNGSFGDLLLLTEDVVSQGIKPSDLGDAVNYLDIEALKGPVANAMIHDMYKKYGGNRNMIEWYILKIPIEKSEIRAWVAKYWFLNYGNVNLQDFILPDLDYGFSIAELLQFHKLPKPEDYLIIDLIPGSSLEGTAELNLKNLRINDLTGLNAIPNISSVTVLNLDNNRLSHLPPKVFTGLNKLELLGLKNNWLTDLKSGVFAGLSRLRRLNLGGNRLTRLGQGVFDGINQNCYIFIEGNQLDKAEVDNLRKQFTQIHEEA